MANKNVLLTGVSRGLGLYLCKRLVADNYHVIGIDIQTEEDLNPELRKILLKYYSFDLNCLEEIKNIISKIITENTSVHILINNAGLKSFKEFVAYTDVDYIKVNNVNFLAPSLLSKALIPYMKLQNEGKIINIASNAGFEGYKKGSAYCSSKGALHLFTQSVAAELNKHITINAISPASIATSEFLDENPKINPNKYIQPEEVYQIIKKILNSNRNGKIIPVVRMKSKLKYLFRDLQKYFNWFFFN